MATIRTELTRDGQEQPWVTVRVIRGKEMEIVFSGEGGDTTVHGLSWQDAADLGDIIRNTAIDYMGGGEDAAE